MKQEASKKKSKLWLWLVIGAVALLAAAGVVLALVLGGGEKDTGPKGGRPELYWNIDRKTYTENSESGLSTREPGEDGNFKVRFAINGEVIELVVADKQLINYIDTMDAMGLVKDSDGTVVDVIDPKDIAKEVNKNAYVKSATANKIVANTSVAMNGMNINVKLEEGLTEIYDVTPQAEVPGQKITTADLKAMDTLVIYANDMDQVTHVYVNSHSKQSKVYWRAEQNYNSTEKATARVPDENGAYTIPFFCEGEVVELKTKDKTIATKIDSISRWKCHFGFTFDEEGYIIEQYASAIGIQGVMVADCWDIVEIDGDTYTIQRLTTNDGSVWTGTIPAGTTIYEAGVKAKREGQGGRKIDSLQMGDRVTVWTDTNGQVVLVYVAERLVDSPAYWNPTRKYSSTTKETTREIGPSGYYEIELIKEGSNKKEIYYVKDKETMSYMDSITSKIMGLKVLPGNIVEFAYSEETLTGYTTATRGGVVTTVTGGIFTKMTYGKRGTESNMVLAANARIYNVSQYGELGAVTTIQPGDHVYGVRQPTGEILLAYVTKRTIGGEKLYWNLETMWDKTNKTSTRVPDADGWYHFTMAHQGKQVELKTKNKDLVEKIDKLSIGATALDVSGSVITAVYDAGYPYGGNKVASGYKFQYVTSEGKYYCEYASDANKTVEFVMAEDCVIYNVSPIFDSHKGERIYSIPKDSMLTVFCDIYGEAKVVYVRSKSVKEMYWKTEILYDSTNKVTKRVPDADGYYWYDLAVNGECKRFKTKDQKIANSMDSYAGAFGLNVRGDEIFGFVATSSVQGVSGNGYTTASVVAINGRSITVETAGKTETMKLSSDCKIYDVSPVAEKFGQVSTLKVGDIVRTYLNKDKSAHNYVYIKARAARVKGEVGYCEHCKTEVKWKPMDGSSAISSSSTHWYVPANLTAWVQSSFVSTAKDYQICLDLNGKILTRAENGRMFRVAEGEVLNIMDSVGGGKIVSGGGTSYNGGMFLMTTGGKVNLYGGTLEFVQGEYKNGSGGIAYLSGQGTEFNIYDGVVTGGRAYSQNKTNAKYGGNFYISGGATLNMYGGEISGGKAYGVLDATPNKDGVLVYSAVNAYGGNIYMTESSNVNILGGVVKDGEAVRETFTAPDGKTYTNMSFGGNIYKVNTQKFNGLLYIENATISGGRAHRGGNINAYATSGATAKIEDPNYSPDDPYQGGYVVLNKATVIDGTASQYGGNIMSNCANWTIIDSTIQNGISNAHGGNIYSQGGIYYVISSSISNGQAGSGGNIYLYKNKNDANVFVVEEGTVIEDGVASSSGGNIYVKSKNYVRLSDGTAVEPKDNDGTGEPMLPTLGLIGGEIKNGQAATGADIYSAGHTALMGGVVSGDFYFHGDKEAMLEIAGSEISGEFQVKAPAEFAIYGTPKIANLVLDNSVKATVGEMTEGASVKVSSASGTIVFTEGFDAAQDYLTAGYFSAYDSAQEIKVTQGNELMLRGADLNQVYEQAKAMDFSDADADGKVTAKCPVCREEVEWSVLPTNASGKSLVVTGGHYYLSESVDYTQNTHLYSFTTQETLCLHLNGQNLTSASRVFYTEKSGTVLNVMGDGTVTGAGYMSSGKGFGAMDLTTEANFFGGTYISTGAGPAIGNRKTSTGEALVSIYAGTTVINEAVDGYAMYVVGNGSFAINGGTVNGVVAESGSKGITVSGAPTVNYIQLSNGRLLNIGLLETGASITVDADGVFTHDIAGVAALKDFFHAVDDREVVVEGSALALAKGKSIYEKAKEMDFTTNEADGKVTAECPVCKTTVDWYPMPVVDDANTSVNNRKYAFADGKHHHYYLDANTDYTQNTGYYGVSASTKMCLNLNGQNVVSAQRAFWNESAATVVNIMGDGSITGNGFKVSATAYRAAFDGTAAFNLYGGTYASANEYPVFQMRSSSNTKCVLSIYEGTTIQTATSACALEVLNKSTINIYGGSVLGGSVVKNSGTAALYIEGNPVIEKLDLTNGKTVAVGELVDGASIYVEADGVFTSEVANTSNVKYFTTVSGKKVTVDNGNLSVVEDAPMVCPHCGKTEAELEAAGTPWTEWNHENYGSGTKGTITSGHYYMTKNVTDMNGYYYIGASTDDDDNNLSVDVVLDMRGFSLQSNTRVFYGYTNNHLTIWDSVGGSTVQGGLANSAGGTIFMGDGGGKASLKLYNVNFVDGATAKREKTGGVIFLSGNTTLVMENSTLTGGTASSGGSIYLSSGEAVINNSTISGGSGTKGGDIYVGSGTLNLTDSTVDDIWMNDASSNIIVNGVSVIGKLDLTNKGALVTVGELSDGASITVVADGVFTNALTDAEAVEDFFHSGVSDKNVIVEGNALAIGVKAPEPDAPSVYEQAKAMDFSAGGTVTATCPACGENHDWAPLPAPTSSSTNVLPAGAYYVADDMQVTKFWYIAAATGGKVCINLNGKSITNTADRVIYAEGSSNVLNIMGEGTVIGASKYPNQANKNYVGVLDSCTAVNLYGGTYCSSTEYPVVANRGSGVHSVLNIYEGTKIVRTSEDVQGLNLFIADNATVNMYGGIISGGTAIGGDDETKHPLLGVGKSGGNVLLKVNLRDDKNWNYDCSFNLYGGTVENGTAENLGGNIAVVGNDLTNPSATVNICGGTVANGSVVAVGANAFVTVSGTPVVDYIDVVNANLLTVGELKDGASIKVNATKGEAFTNAIAENAETYAQYFTADGDMTAAIVKNNALVLADVCPHCNVEMSAIAWQELVIPSDVQLLMTESGHYYLSQNYENVPKQIGVKGGDIVIDFRGHTINVPGNSRGFYVGSETDDTACSLSLMDSVGNGGVSTAYTNSGAVLYVITAVNKTTNVLNVYGGTYTATTTPANGGCVCNTRGIVNIYGGTFNGTTIQSGKLGGNVYTNGGTTNIYGGTFTNGNAGGKGDCMYVTDHNSGANGILNVFGGTIEGQVYVKKNAEISISGAPVIAQVDLEETVKIDLGELRDGADITVKADGAFTNANGNAEAYVEAGYIKAVENHTITAESNVLYMVAVTLLKKLASFLGL